MRRILVGVCAVIVCFAASVNGTDKTWDNNEGNGDGNWSTGTNWNPEGVPGSSDNAIFDGTSTDPCTVDSAATVASLSINSGYTDTITMSANLTITGAFTLGDGTLSAGSYTLDIGGDADFSAGGTFTCGTSTLELTGANSTFTAGGKTFYNIEIMYSPP